MAADKSLQVCVLGGGVIGLSVATHLLETYRDSMVVTVIADKYTPDTIASDKAGSIVMPSIDPKDCLGNDSTWLKASIDRYHTLYQQETSTGIARLSGHYLKPDTQKGQSAWFKHLMPSYCDVTNSPDKRILPGYEDKEFVNCSTFIIAPTQYMEYLINRIKLLGGVLVTQRIESMSSLNSYHAIINCTGLGARELARDSNVYPMKGTMVAVWAPWVKHWLLETKHKRIYIFPRYNNEVVLGAHNEENVEDTLINEEKTQAIIKDCASTVPSLANATVTNQWSGIRPMRKGGVRLEKDETIVNGSVVIHNYGHGTEGIMKSWGCAEEVGDIIGQSLGLRKKVDSKL